MMIWGKLRGLASYAIVRDLAANLKCVRTGVPDPLHSGLQNARLSSSVPKARPGTVTQTQNAGEAVSTLSAQQGGARPSNQEAASDSGAQVQPDQPPPDDLENAEPWMAEEIRAYYAGRRRLAKMMGCDPATFTDKDVAESLRYLLPSALSAKDARPFLKHPSLIFPKRAESAFSPDGRPLEPAFYTGATGYQNLIHEIFRHKAMIDGSSPQGTEHVESTSTQEGEGAAGREPGAASPPLEEEAGSSYARPLVWVKKDTLSNLLHEELSEAQYDDLVKRLVRLAEHPQSGQIKGFLDQYRRPVFVYRTHAKIPQLNGREEATALGRRKTSTARVTVKKGNGAVTVNGVSLIQYFPRVEDRHQVLYPFMRLDILGAFDVAAKVWGGGTTGQAGAIRLGISKAMLAFPGDYGDNLEAAGLLIRDPRMVERKKPGQKKARKKFTWVKR